MKYNKVKRALEKSSAIYFLVCNAIELLFGLPLFLYYYLNNGGDDAPILIVGIILLALSLYLYLMMLSIKLIPSPVQKDGTVEQRNGIRITFLVFSILTGNFVSAGLMIAVLCLKDIKESKTTTSSIEAKIAKIKELKDLGAIDEQTYKNAITKIINEIAEQ